VGNSLIPLDPRGRFLLKFCGPSRNHLRFAATNVIGDTVNLASRLEGLNTLYGSCIMASEITVAACAGAVEFRELDLVAVKGRQAPIRVFEVLGLPGNLDLEIIRGRQEFVRALELYRRGRFPGAQARFEAIVAANPADGPARGLRDRNHRFQAGPRPADGDTVFRPDAK